METLGALSRSTAWTRTVETPLRRFLRTETGSASILLAATLAALAWANIDSGSYHDVWSTRLTVSVGHAGVSQPLDHWVNNGLMAFFFFVVGLEARREFDIGELRERSRMVQPLLASVGGMAAAVAIYLAINAGHPSTSGWGVAMSTDTAFALGVLALVGPRFPDRLRVFILTVVVVDDVLALVVIGGVYTEHLVGWALLVGVAFFAVAVIVRRARIRVGTVYAALATASWVALLKSGVDPVVIGLAMGLIAYAGPAARSDLELATDLFRRFREQPTSALARTAQRGLKSAVSPNERLAELWHPWTSYLIVPLFALANAGIVIDGGFLSRAYGSPVTLGIIAGYVLGKPAGILGTSWLVTTVTRGRVRPAVGWAAVAGGAAVSGIGFTVSLLIATIAFSGEQLQEAKLGVLTAALGAAVLGAIVFRVTAALPAEVRARALLGTTESIVDLARPVEEEHDHLRGPADAPVTLVEYGDFECPYCGRAEPIVRDLLAQRGDVRYVWRHLPLTDVHPHAQLAAEAAEAAARQSAFWEMHDLMLEGQDALRPADLTHYAERLGLDVERFARDLQDHAGAAHIADDVDSADLSGVSGTPTFFINGQRHYGAYDIDTLSKAVAVALTRARLVSA